MLLNLDTAAYHGLNEMGALIWSLIEGGTTFEALVRDLRDRVGDAPEELGTDVAVFLSELEERGLVTIGDDV